MIIHTTKP
jgi:hypothetical protein